MTHTPRTHFVQPGDIISYQDRSYDIVTGLFSGDPRLEERPLPLPTTPGIYTTTFEPREGYLRLIRDAQGMWFWLDMNSGSLTPITNPLRDLSRFKTLTLVHPYTV